MKSAKVWDFHKLFKRILKTVDLSDCKTPEDINQRLLAKIKEQQSESPSPNSVQSESAGVE